ncbi:MAG: hypothetical protein ACYC2T_11445 [Bacillota bacterium]
MKGLLHDERGTVTVWFLLFLPLVLISMIFLVNQTQSVTGSDIDLGGSVKSAVRASAMQVTMDSQAAGTPRINTTAAQDAFRYELARNLGLNAVTLDPLPGSLLAQAPDYVLVIYNGDGTFMGSGARTAYKYTFQGGVLSSGDLVASGFPRQFGVIATDVSLGAGTLNVTLDKPGVVAVIKERQTRIMGTEDMDLIRWASAKVVYNAF